MISAQRENAKMLASILGIDEDEAAEKLNRTVLITAPKAGSAHAWAIEVAEQLGRTIHVIHSPSRIVPDLELVISDLAPVSSGPTLYAYLNNERMIVGSSRPVQFKFEGAHGLLASAAACSVAGAVLYKVLDAPELPHVSDPMRFEFDQLGLDPAWLEGGLDLTGSVLIGAGAVGNGFLRGLRHLKPIGTLPIIDPKTVGGGNINRCLFFSENDVNNPKAEALANAAKIDFPGVILEPFFEGFSEYCAAHGPPLRAIVTVDSRRTRRSIQKEMPWQIVDASTTDVREVIVHSNTAMSSGACLACIYRHVADEHAREASIASGLGISIDDVKMGLIDEEIAARIVLNHPGLDAVSLIGMAFDSLFKQLCGAQALKTPEGKQVFAPFAFVSNLAGSLLAVELLRQVKRGEKLEANYWSTSPWTTPDRRMRRFKQKRPDCEFCSKPETATVLKTVWRDQISG